MEAINCSCTNFLSSSHCKNACAISWYITDSHYIWSLRYKINVWMFQKNWNCYDFYKEGLWSKIYACFWKKLMLKPCVLVACVNHTWEQLKSCLVSLSSRQPFVQTDNNISVLFSNTVLWWVWDEFQYCKMIKKKIQLD